MYIPGRSVIILSLCIVCLCRWEALESRLQKRKLEQEGVGMESAVVEEGGGEENKDGEGPSPAKMGRKRYADKSMDFFSAFEQLKKTKDEEEAVELIKYITLDLSEFRDCFEKIFNFKGISIRQRACAHAIVEQPHSLESKWR